MMEKSGCKDIFVNLRLNKSQLPELSQLCVPTLSFMSMFASGLIEFHAGGGGGGAGRRINCLFIEV